jgi:hyaluronan synthase
MFKFTKKLYSYFTSASSAAAYSPRFGGAYADYRMPLSIDSGSKFCILLIVAAILYSGILTMEQFKAAAEQMRSTHSGAMYLAAVRMLLLISVSVFLWRLVLVLFYKPAATLSDAKLPKITVIVPAYNEGSCVLKTLRSVLKSDYPAEKLQIIAVNDGSKDDTLHWMQLAVDKSNGRIDLINFPQNRGKRHAIYEGVRAGKGSIIITIDSDSIIERQTLRRLVSPFADPQVGAVAGNVRVLNRRDGIIPKMLEVSFAYSFDFIRASQSMVNSVFCTPGALSAYRKKSIIKDMKEWRDQTFLGKPATIGEDRAITNLVLRNGYDVRYQSNSMVYTIVPTNYKQLVKMFLRWARSNVRESLVMGEFIFKKFRKGSRYGAIINFIMSILVMVIPQAIIGAVMCAMFMNPQVYVSQVAFGTVLASTIPVIFYSLRHRSSEALWAYAYGLFWLVALWWIAPWAIITMSNGKWLTRELPQTRKDIVTRICEFIVKAA